MSVFERSAECGAVRAEAVVATIRDVTKLRGEVTLRQPGELPNDGKVVEDARKYE